VEPEQPLVDSFVDRLKLTAPDILTVGPIAAAARLESSKAYSKDFMVRHGIRTAKRRSFHQEEDVHH